MSIYELLLKHKDILPNGVSINDQKIYVPNYFEISPEKIKLFDVDMMSKMESSQKESLDVFDKYFSFIEKIKGHIVKLNHLGFGYKAINIESEIKEYGKHLGNELELVEEDSGDKLNNRWFFIRPFDKSVPKIELILYSSDKYKDYCPQFQIDIDTDLPFEELKKITDEMLNKDFFFWSYDVPNYGTVMAMGKIGQIDGVKILVGLGTNLRKPQTFKKI